MRSASFWQALGPGLLFAGAAVGVSHLVQATRAGAQFGLGLLFVVVLANLIKYPAFAFGPWYAAATGTSLLEGYRRRGRWALVVFTLLTLLTGFTVQGVVTLVTAALARGLLGLPLGPGVAELAITLLCAGLLAIGRYRWLDRVVKVAVVTLTLATLLATALSIPRLFEADGPALQGPWPFFTLDAGSAQLLFIAALVGWMPSAIDISVWHSLWGLARARDVGRRPTLAASRRDTNVGYLGTALLALCFLVLGAAVLRGEGDLPGGAAAFAERLVSLYGSTLGSWSEPFLAVAALLVMFSTTLTVVDGFARTSCVLVARFRSVEVPVDASREESAEGRGGRYWLGLLVFAVASLGLLAYARSGAAAMGLKELVDLATTLSFLTAPVLAALNHAAIFGPEVAAQDRPSAMLRRFSLACIGIMTALALGYLALRWGLRWGLLGAGA